MNNVIRIDRGNNVPIVEESEHVHRGDGGSGGGGDMEDRIKKLEKQLTEIQTDLAILKSNNSTKNDILSLGAEIKIDMANVRNEVKADITTLRTEMKTDIANLRTEMKVDSGNSRTEIHSSINTQTKWLAATIIGVAALSLAIARFLF